MNGCNMSRITTHHATHSLMASHNARDVPTDGIRGEGEGGGGGGCSVEVEKWRL